MDVSWEPGIVSPLGVLCANVMEQIEERYGDAKILTAAVVVEVDTDDSTDILTACTDQRAWVQIKFLDEALSGLERARDRLEAEAEE